MKITVFYLLIIFIFVGCGSSNIILDEEDIAKIVDTISINDSMITKTHQYHNPIIMTSLPDPTVLKVGKTYYLYATENIRNIPIYKSDNLIEWQYIGTAFSDKTRPNIVKKGSLWAPDINYINGKYVLYFSQSNWGEEWSCGIGVAISDKPDGPFIDLGKLFTSREIEVQNSIDPFFYEENGHKYLFWGGLRGIYGIELSNDGLSLKKGSLKQKIAGNNIEGSYIHKHNQFYYLFASNGSCCNGVYSTYKVVVGRSENLFGPYTTKAGKSLLDENYEVFLKSSSFVAGPGHNAEFIQDKNGEDWIIYHGYLKSDPDAGRLVFMDKIIWKDGWPYIKNSIPSELSERPVMQ